MHRKVVKTESVIRNKGSSILLPIFPMMEATEKIRTKLEIKDMSLIKTVINTYFLDLGTRLSKRLLIIILVKLC